MVTPVVPDVIELGQGRFLGGGRATVLLHRALRKAIEEARRNGVTIDALAVQLDAVLARQAAHVLADPAPAGRAVDGQRRRLSVQEVMHATGLCERQARRVTVQHGGQKVGRQWFIDAELVDQLLADRAMSACPTSDVRCEGGSS